MGVGIPTKLSVARDSVLKILRWECQSVMLGCREVWDLNDISAILLPSRLPHQITALWTGVEKQYLLMRDFNLLLWRLAPVRSGSSWPP